MTVELVGEHCNVAAEAERRIRELIAGAGAVKCTVENPEHVYPDFVQTKPETNNK